MTEPWDPTLAQEPPGALPTVQPNTLVPFTGLPQLPTRPDLQSNPLMDVGRMLMGFAAGTQGRMNPIMLYEEQARQEDARRQLAAANLAMTERARRVQEQQFDLNQKIEERRAKTEEDKVGMARQTLSAEMGLKLIENSTPELRVQGYRLLQQAGQIGKDADPTKLALLTKPDFTMARDEAIALLDAGVDPESPAFGGRYSFLPMAAYKAMAQENPLGLNSLRSKPLSEEQALKAVVARISSLPPERVMNDEGLQRQLTAAHSALQIGRKVNYGERVNAELAAMGVKDPALATTEQMTEAIRRASVEQGPPTLERLRARRADLERKIANANTPEEFAALKDVKTELDNVIAHQEGLIGDLARVAGARTAAMEKERPLDDASRKETAGYQKIYTTLHLFSTFKKEELEQYGGRLQNPKERAKMAAGDVLRSLGVNMPQDERFAQFQALMGQFQKGLFVEAGKQLTGIEWTIQQLATPKPSDSPTEMMAKIRYLEAFTRISEKAMLTLSKVGKGYVEPGMLDAMIRDEMKKAGIGIPDGHAKPWMPQVTIPQGYKPVPQGGR